MNGEQIQNHEYISTETCFYVLYMSILYIINHKFHVLYFDLKLSATSHVLQTQFFSYSLLLHLK